MKEFLIGAGSAFALLVVNKTILEPAATYTGRRLLNRFVGPACAHLDIALSILGIYCDPEAEVRAFLDLEPEELSEAEIDRIVQAVFEVWDVRVATGNTRDVTLL